MKPPRPSKPIGQPTRGKTADNRLRRVDNFILLYEPALLTRADSGFADSMFVDIVPQGAASVRAINCKLGGGRCDVLLTGYWHKETGVLS